MKSCKSPLVLSLPFLFTVTCQSVPDQPAPSQPVATAAPARSSPDADAPTPEQLRMKAELEALVAGRENEPAENVFKNIQVFKGMRAGQLLDVMTHGFVPALGVQCGECHVPGKWESDDKHDKEVARDMVLMTRNINQQVKQAADDADATVSCYTCHRGSTKPATAPAS